MISVIVPVYNTEKFLKRCIDSILNQTYKNIEVILVDDGSTDNSGIICDEYAKADARVVVIHKQNNGVAEARNSGLDVAQGEYIGFVDSDDYIEPDMYAKMMNALLTNEASICCCGYYQEEKGNLYKKCCTSLSVYDNADSIFRAYYRQDIDTGIGSGNWNKLFRKDSINNIRYVKFTNGEDIDFQCSTFKACRKIVCIPDILYHYMCADNDDSATNKLFNQNHLDVLKVADEQIDYIKKSDMTIYQEAYAFHLAWYISALQKIYDEGWQNIRKHGNTCYVNNIRTVIKKNKKYYKKNMYAKRLDKYYMYALLYHCMPIAILFRKFVILMRNIIRG